MKTVKFAQAIDVEVWVEIEVPDDYLASDVEQYIQDFRFEVSVREIHEATDGDHDTVSVTVADVTRHGAAEVLAVTPKVRPTE